jgi:hypothetical protein
MSIARRLLPIPVVLLAAACAGDGGEAAPPAAPATTPTTAASPTSEASQQQFPDVLAAALQRSGDRWTVAATISSPYDTPERYADAFRVLAPDGTVLGVRELLHDHAGEQPFTRSLDGVDIPPGVDEVTVEGRDLVHGWGGATVTVDVPR